MNRNRILVKGNEMLSPEKLGMQEGHLSSNHLPCLLYSCYLIFMTKFLGWFYYKVLFFYSHYLSIYSTDNVVKIEYFNNEGATPVRSKYSQIAALHMFYYHVAKLSGRPRERKVNTCVQN